MNHIDNHCNERAGKMSLEITWFHHVSFRLAALGSGEVVYIDPWKMPSASHDGTVAFVSHEHYDHCSPADVAKVLGPAGQIVCPPGTAGQFASAREVSPGESLELGPVRIEAVPAYNIGKKFHPKRAGWCGAVISLAGRRIYFAGDTDLVPEMSELGEIDLALLPVGGTYTMNASKAARACEVIRPARAIPCHWGEIVGSIEDARQFASLAPCPVTVLQPGQTVRDMFE